MKEEIMFNRGGFKDEDEYEAWLEYQEEIDIEYQEYERKYLTSLENYDIINM